MDFFFEHLPWFVPGAKYDIVDRHARENELRHGELYCTNRRKEFVLMITVFQAKCMRMKE